MSKAALQPIHHILAQDYITIIDKLYRSFDIEAEAHEHDLKLIVDTLKGLKSGKITLNQIEVTDDAWEVLDADMAPSEPTQISNGNRSNEEAKDAVPATSS